MTVKKAIQIVNLAIKNKQNKKTGLLDPTQSWNQEELRTFEFAKTLAEVIDNDIEWLRAIKKQLKSKKSNCKHPKNMRDKAGDTLYCMNCNADL